MAADGHVTALYSSTAKIIIWNVLWIYKLHIGLLKTYIRLVMITSDILDGSLSKNLELQGGGDQAEAQWKMNALVGGTIEHDIDILAGSKMIHCAESADSSVTKA